MKHPRTGLAGLCLLAISGSACTPGVIGGGQVVPTATGSGGSAAEPAAGGTAGSTASSGGTGGTDYGSGGSGGSYPTASGGAGGSPPVVEADAGPVAPAITFDMIYTNIFSKQCGPGCHLTGMAGGLPMKDAATALMNLVDKPSVCKGLPRVTPGKPDMSVLSLILKGPVPGCAMRKGRMPEKRPPLSDADIQMVDDWITGGAK